MRPGLEPEPLNAVQIALEYPREQLYQRIDARVDRMIASGLVDEVRRLVEKGYAPHLNRIRTLGYREIIAHLEGRCSLEEAVEATKQNTRRFAKRQLTWFRPDGRIH